MTVYGQKLKFRLSNWHTLILFSFASHCKDWASLVAQLVKNPPAMWETWVQSLGWKGPLEKGTSYPLQYSGLDNSMDFRVAKSQTRLSNFHFHFEVIYKTHKTVKLATKIVKK